MDRHSRIGVHPDQHPQHKLYPLYYKPQGPHVPAAQTMTWGATFQTNVVRDYPRRMPRTPDTTLQVIQRLPKNPGT